ncbi:hypothetical protein [Coxiella-like endosymbiont]|uniref:hypothetical protein n=1 Tax=Coxiella-like endosymbiont TaxID=1592897 RepID=UPI0034E264B4
MDSPHFAAIEYKLMPLNWSDEIEIRSGIDGNLSTISTASFKRIQRITCEI